MTVALNVMVIFFVCARHGY